MTNERFLKNFKSYKQYIFIFKKIEHRTYLCIRRTIH